MTLLLSPTTIKLMKTQETDLELLFELGPKSVHKIYVGLPGLNCTESLKGHGDVMGIIQLPHGDSGGGGGGLIKMHLCTKELYVSVQNDAKLKSRDKKRKQRSMRNYILMD